VVAPLTREVQVTREVVREVPRETFVISGVVVEWQTGVPIKDAALTVSDFPDTPVQADPSTGAFKTFPLPVGAGAVVLQVRAPGYKPEAQPIARLAHAGTANVTVALHPDRAAFGVLQGSLKDRHTGKPLRGVVFVPTAELRGQADENGAFRLQLKAGRYEILVSAPGHVTQRAQISVHDGEVVILNLDLTRDEAGPKAPQRGTRRHRKD
jgi:hypothetical protein